MVNNFVDVKWLRLIKGKQKGLRILSTYESIYCGCHKSLSLSLSLSLYIYIYIKNLKPSIYCYYTCITLPRPPCHWLYNHLFIIYFLFLNFVDNK